MVFSSDEYTLITICIDPNEKIGNLRCIKDIYENIKNVFMDDNFIEALLIAKHKVKRIKNIPDNGLIIHTGISIKNKVKTIIDIDPYVPDEPVKRNFFSINNRFYFTKSLGYS